MRVSKNIKQRVPLILYGLFHLFGWLIPLLFSSHAQAFIFQECGIWRVHGQFAKGDKTSKEGDQLNFILNKGTDSQYTIRIQKLNAKTGAKIFPLDVSQDITLMFTKSCYYNCEASIVLTQTPAVSTPKKIKSLKCLGSIEFKKDEEL